VDLNGGDPGRMPAIQPAFISGGDVSRPDRRSRARRLMAAEGYEFARDVQLGDSPAWPPWHVVELVRQ